MDNANEGHVDPALQRPRRKAAMAAAPAAAHDIPADGNLPLGLRLAFGSARYERRFVDHYVAFYFRYAQVSLVLGMFLVFGDFLVDRFADPGSKANFLRLQLCLPILGVGLAYTFTSDARKHWQPAMAGFVAAVAYCMFWILLRIDAEGGAGLRSWVGILNFTFFEFYCFVILGVQFRYALASGAVILVGFEAAMWANSSLSAGAVAYWSYHVVTLFMLAAGIGWWREYLLRKEFSIRSSLDEARATAEHMTRMKSEFLASMSHEIRTPMSGVLGMTELLLDTPLSEAQRRHAHTIRSSGEGLLTILNDILDFSKIEAGRVELDAVDVDLRDLCEEALQLLALPAQQKGLELALRVAPEVPSLVRADPVRLRQVLINLLGNAVKFTHSGDVTLFVARTAPTVPATDSSACELRFCIADTGIGIGKQAQARLFQPFVQADGSTTRRYGGTGLGLVVSKQLVELMGGTVGVDSEVGRGSSFWFTTRVDVLASRASAGPDLRGIRVLIVDDNATSRIVLLEQIAALGGSGIAASDGPSALELLRAAVASGNPWQVALVGTRRVGASGIELARAIRADHTLRDTALVLLAPVAEAGDAEVARAADAVLTKPTRRRELGSALIALAGGSAPTVVAAKPAPEPAIDCAGARVLVAEDNDVNQLIARSMLEGAGCHVTVAENGRIALDLWRTEAFELVLMDCQMPELDGFETALAIRADEAGTGGRIPIVALTANAMQGDRERCLATGMDDYLPKPFRRAELTAVLRRWLDPAPADEPFAADGAGRQPKAANRPVGSVAAAAAAT
jgi:signal transduction histidine kinase/CheY-like chemotaxis protein